MRVFAGCIIVCLSVLVPPMVLLPLAVLHAFSWVAYELIFIGVAIDAYFGTVSPFPYYTIAAILIVIAAEWIKPHLSFYTEA